LRTIFLQLHHCLLHPVAKCTNRYGQREPAIIEVSIKRCDAFRHLDAQGTNVLIATHANNDNKQTDLLNGATQGASLGPSLFAESGQRGARGG
jgi:hypothetical protein